MKTNTFLGWAFADKKSSTDALYNSVRNLCVSLTLDGFSFEVKEKIYHYGYKRLSDAKDDKGNLKSIRKFLKEFAKSKNLNYEF